MRSHALQQSLRLAGLAAAGLALACQTSTSFSTAPNDPAVTPAALAGQVLFQGAPVAGVRLRFVPDPAPRPLDDTLTVRGDAIDDRTGAAGEFSYLARRSGGVTLQVTGVPEGCAAPSAVRHDLAEGEERRVEVLLACRKAPKGGPPVD